MTPLLKESEETRTSTDAWIQIGELGYKGSINGGEEGEKKVTGKNCFSFAILSSVKIADIIFIQF